MPMVMPILSFVPSEDKGTAKDLVKLLHEAQQPMFCRGGSFGRDDLIPEMADFPDTPGAVGRPAALVLATISMKTMKMDNLITVIRDFK